MEPGYKAELGRDGAIGMEYKYVHNRSEKVRSIFCRVEPPSTVWGVPVRVLVGGNERQLR